MTTATDEWIWRAPEDFLASGPHRPRRKVKLWSTRNPNLIVARRVVLTEFFYIRENMRRFNVWENFRDLWCEALTEALSQAKVKVDAEHVKWNRDRALEIED